MQNKVDLTRLSSREERVQAYQWLRTEAPLFDMVINDMPVRVVTRFADVDSLLKNSNAVVQKEPGVSPAHIGSGVAALFYRRSLPHMDTPEHDRYRRIAISAFNRAAMARMASWIPGMIEERLDDLAGRGEVDVMQALARPLPADIACAFLHIPREHGDLMRQRVHDLSPIISHAPLTPELLARGESAVQFFFDYFGEHARTVKDLPEDDMLHILIKAERDGLWDMTDLTTMLAGLFAASYHTTMTSFANVIHALATHPDQLAALVADPGLADRTWEEVLRYDTPAHFVHRHAATPMQVAGLDIEPGTMLLLGLAAANLDDAEFPDAAVFNIQRGPRRHLSFAGGPHFCLGAHLSRLEGRFLLQGLVKRFPHMTLGATPVERFNDITFPHITAMRVILEGDPGSKVRPASPVDLN